MVEEWSLPVALRSLNGTLYNKWRSIELESNSGSPGTLKPEHAHTTNNVSRAPNTIHVVSHSFKPNAITNALEMQRQYPAPTKEYEPIIA